MAVREVKIAIGTFLACTVSFFSLLHNLNVKEVYLELYKILGLLGFCFISSRFIPHIEVVKRSALLGIVCSVGLAFTFDSYYLKWRSLGWYLCALAFFHFSEYVMTAIYNADKLSVDSFLLNHSFEYKMAALASWVEFLVELYFVPVLKAQFVVSFLGLIMVVFGEAFRKIAMVTAKSNFTHLVQYKKREEHILVTWGIYNWCRHPSYVGWFWWSIGTQFILCNPICLFAYAVASWKFFKERISLEEVTLLQFFGKDYINYQHKIGTGIPFIYGFILDKNTEQ